MQGFDRGDIQAATIAVAMALAARLALGYRPFPSIDDFVYIPLSWAHLDPTVFATDHFVQEYVFHVPLLPVIVALSEATVGLAAGALFATLLLSLATMAAVMRLLRSIGASGALLPLVVVIALCGHTVGLGRGQYDGAFGSALHMQWAALCALLWAYDGFLRRRPVLAGGLLGLAALAHPVVGAHGAFVLVLAAVAMPEWRWRPLLLAGIACGLVSAPASVPLSWSLISRTGGTDFDVVRLGYLFRTPHEFELAILTIGVFVLVAALGWAGTILLSARRDDIARRAFGGLMLGQSLLAGFAIGFHGPWSAGSAVEDLGIVFQLHFTRTSPILLVLSAIALAAAIEDAVGSIGGRLTGSAKATAVLFWVCAAFALAMLLLQVRWHPVLWIALALSLATLLPWPERAWRRTVTGLWLVLAVGAGWQFAIETQAEAAQSTDDRDLYAWVRRAAPKDAVFIIPPGLEEFRFYGRRSAYVDFKTFPATTPSLIPEWRNRIEQVSVPDRLALDGTGWDGIEEWDRTYANRNTPARIAELLRSTGAEYFLWDSAGLAVPPYVPVERAPDSRIDVAFRNQRYTVYRLRPVEASHAD